MIWSVARTQGRQQVSDSIATINVFLSQRTDDSFFKMAQAQSPLNARACNVPEHVLIWPGVAAHCLWFEGRMLH